MFTEKDKTFKQILKVHPNGGRQESEENHQTKTRQWHRCNKLQGSRGGTAHNFKGYIPWGSSPLDPTFNAKKYLPK